MELKVEPHNGAPLPEIKSRIVLITGDGRSLPDDLERFSAWSAQHDVFCIGRSYDKVIEVCGNYQHWGDVDGYCSKWWADHLPNRQNIFTHTIGKQQGFDVDWEVEVPWDDNVRWRGSTSLFATMVCQRMGYSQVILAGCPLDSEGHWYFPERYRGPDWAPEDMDAWRYFADLPQAQNVKSLSGFTAEVLGKAERSWV